MTRMPIPTRKQTLELAARFLEHDLHKMREQARQQYEHQSQREDWDGREHPLGSSHEADLMKAVEWAWGAATLRAMAAQEKES